MLGFFCFCICLLLLSSFSIIYALDFIPYVIRFFIFFLLLNMFGFLFLFCFVFFSTTHATLPLYSPPLILHLLIYSGLFFLYFSSSVCVPSYLVVLLYFITVCICFFALFVCNFHGSFLELAFHLCILISHLSVPLTYLVFSGFFCFP